MKLNWNLQRGGGGGGVLEKNPFRRGGMDIFRNYTLYMDRGARIITDRIRYRCLYSSQRRLIMTIL